MNENGVLDWGYFLKKGKEKYKIIYYNKNLNEPSNIVRVGNGLYQ
ncbi:MULTISPECIES: hypothetical protein [Peribacillus]|nr:hypothetical protein [Peribacillus butanolivorans]